MTEFGEQLRKAREAKGMTQQTLAEELYVTRQTVSRWECGDRFPDLITTKKLSQTLEISVDELLSEDEVKKVVSRNPIIDGRIMSKLVLVLYAAITCSLLVTLIDLIIRLPLQSSQIDSSNIQVLVINGLGLIIQICIFTYGFCVVLKKGLAPKETGVIAILYFISICLADFNHVVRSSEWLMTVMALLLVVPSVIGAIASYLFFCKEKYTKCSGIAIVTVCAWGIARMLISTFTMIKYAGQFVSMNTALGVVLKSCIR
jgi:transcriptional regulator with XRE-family HTH domain